MSEPALKALSFQEIIPHFQAQAALVDVRPESEYIRIHVPGSNWVDVDTPKWTESLISLVSKSQRIVLIIDEEADMAAIHSRFLEAGFREVVGFLEGGIETWAENGQQTNSGNVKQISTILLEKMMKERGSEFDLVDVRENYEYFQGRIPGAVLIPLGSIGPRAAELDPAKPLALVCRTGVRSLQASYILAQKGFKEIYNVAGGTMAWTNNGFPIER